MKTLKWSYLYAKTVTLGRTHIPETNAVMGRNRRIGASMSGIAQFITHRGIVELQKWCESGYKEIQRRDKQYSGWFQVPESIKTTSIKPSGSVSLLNSSTSGMHYPESRFYIRRMRLSKGSELVPALLAANYTVEPAVDAPNDTVVLEVPVDVGKGIRTSKEVSMWEQLSLAIFLQEYWADNQVSCTVTFDPKTEGHQLEHALNYAQTKLKGISFLPRVEKGAYAQMPYEEITEEVYKSRVAVLLPLVLPTGVVKEAPVPERGCDGSSCEIAPVPPPLVKNHLPSLTQQLLSPKAL